MNDLNKLGSFLAIAQIAQLPLVFFIAVLFYKAIKVLGIKELLWVSLAFISNLFYILFTILSNKISPFYTSLLTIPYSSALSIILDLCTSLFFYIGTITWYYREKIEHRSRSGSTNKINTWKQRGIMLVSLGTLILLCLSGRLF